MGHNAVRTSNNAKEAFEDTKTRTSERPKEEQEIEYLVTSLGGVKTIIFRVPSESSWEEEEKREEVDSVIDKTKGKVEVCLKYS